MWSSAFGRWRTPADLFAALDAEFHFTLDACAEPGASLCAASYSEGSLAMPWKGTVWCNPPYGRGMGEWVRKAADAADRGATVVMLIPSRTDTRWWHEDVLPRAAQVRFIRGRLRFQGADASAPFPSCLVIFTPPG